MLAPLYPTGCRRDGCKERDVSRVVITANHLFAEPKPFSPTSGTRNMGASPFLRLKKSHESMECRLLYHVYPAKDHNISNIWHNSRSEAIKYDLIFPDFLGFTTSLILDD